MCFHCFIVSISTSSGPAQNEVEEYLHQISAKLTQKLGYTERNTKETKLIKNWTGSVSTKIGISGHLWITEFI